MNTCIECPFFRLRESGCVCGLVSGRKFRVKPLNECRFFEEFDDIDREQAVMILHSHQKWRRGANVKMVSPKLVGLSIDKAIQSLRKVK